MKRKKKGAAAWAAIHKIAIDDDMKEILAMSEEELDREIVAAGGDPAKIAAEGVALVERLQERRERLGWQTELAYAEREWQEHKAEIVARRIPRTRDELKARIDAARNDPRFTAPVAATFRDRSKAEPTDDELRVFVEQIEILERLALSRKKDA